MGVKAQITENGRGWLRILVGSQDFVAQQDIEGNVDLDDLITGLRGLQRHVNEGGNDKSAPPGSFVYLNKRVLDMPRLDHLAAMAMQGLMANSGYAVLSNYRTMAEHAYSMADAMLAESKKRSSR